MIKKYWLNSVAKKMGYPSYKETIKIGKYFSIDVTNNLFCYKDNRNRISISEISMIQHCNIYADLKDLKSRYWQEAVKSCFFKKKKIYIFNDAKYLADAARSGSLILRIDYIDKSGELRCYEQKYCNKNKVYEITSLIKGIIAKNKSFDHCK